LFGLGLTVLAFLLPWLLFVVGRWIARGFRDWGRRRERAAKSRQQVPTRSLTPCATRGCSRRGPATPESVSTCARGGCTRSIPEPEPNCE